MKQHSAIIFSLLALAGCSSEDAPNPVPIEPPAKPPVETPPQNTKPDCVKEGDKCYVRVKDGQFTLDGQPYKYMGANFWAAPYVSREKLRTELDLLKGLGVKNLRIMALSEGDIPDAQRDDKVYGPQRITPASSDSPCADATLDAFTKNLKEVLDEIDARGMKAVLTLNDFYQWSGGMMQYLKWAHEQPTLSCEKTYDAYTIDGTKDPETGMSLLKDAAHVQFEKSSLYDTATGGSCKPVPFGAFTIPSPNTLPAGADVGQAWADIQDLSSMFICNKKAQELFYSRAEVLITQLKDHPGIMAWQLANEPRSWKGWDVVFRLWVEKSAKFIKDIDPNHLVSIGSEGDLYHWGDYANSDFENFSAAPGIDYMTFHVWPENWSWYDPALPIDSTEATSLSSAITMSQEFIDKQVAHAKNLKMPIVVEEFGLARDDKAEAVKSGVTKRNAYYTEVFKKVVENEELAGVNFWAWAGTGRPAHPFWLTGDEYIGDPPHEQQGWYSVYDSDTTTLMLIEQFAKDINTPAK